MQDKFTEEEYQQLKDLVARTKDYLQDGDLTLVWNSYKKITNSQENQPCGCGSAAGLWKKAVDNIKEYVTQNG
jgi:hypothetical protein